MTGNLRLLVNLGFLIISYFMLKILFKYRQKLVIELVKSGIDEGYFKKSSGFRCLSIHGCLEIECDIFLGPLCRLSSNATNINNRKVNKSGDWLPQTYLMLLE